MLYSSTKRTAVTMSRWPFKRQTPVSLIKSHTTMVQSFDPETSRLPSLLKDKALTAFLCPFSFTTRSLQLPSITLHFALLDVPDPNIPVRVACGNDILLRTATYFAHLRGSILQAANLSIRECANANLRAELYVPNGHLLQRPRDCHGIVVTKHHVRIRRRD